MSAPRVSVVLPTYNRERTIARAVASVLAQTWRDLELIVVDDGSSDRTREILAGIDDPRLVYVYRDNGGVSSARNLGLERARGEYVAFQDSDDEWCVDKLARQVAALDAHPQASLVVCGFVVPNELSLSMIGVDAREPVVDVTGMATLRLPACQCWLARLADVRALGGFDLRIDCFEDWELALRLAGRGRVLMVNEVLVLKTRTPGSLFEDQHFARNLRLIMDWHRSLLASDPAAWAFYCNLMGQTEARYASTRAARPWFLQAIRAQPRGARGWANLAASLFGRRVFGRYVALARRLRAAHAAPVRPALPRGPA